MDWLDKERVAAECQTERRRSKAVKRPKRMWKLLNVTRDKKPRTSRNVALLQTF